MLVARCENVIGHFPLSLGVAGLNLIDGRSLQIPMTNTEDCLTALASRECKVISSSDSDGARD